MIGREDLELAMVAYSEAGTVSFGAHMAGVDPDDLMRWATDCTGEMFEETLDPGESLHGVRAGLIATGVLIGLNAARAR